MKNWRKYLKQRMAQGLMLLALGAFAQLTVQAQGSADGSRNSGTGAAKRSEPQAVSSEQRVSSPRVSKGAQDGERRTDAERVSSPRVSKGAQDEEKRRQGEEENLANESEPGTVVTGSKTGDIQRLINACAAAAEDLAKTRILADALENENGLLKERLETEKRTSAVLLELNETRKAEAASLRETVAAKNETILAKDGVIAAQDKLIETLKKKKTSPLKRLGDVLIGIGLMAVFR